METTYREKIINAVNSLVEAREIIFGQIVNIAMSNEYKDLHNAFEEGEGFTFHLNHFEKMEDINVQKMVELCRKTEEITFSIMNLNGIEDYEVKLD
jgi:type II secretory pathway component PulF